MINFLIRRLFGRLRLRLYVVAIVIGFATFLQPSFCLGSYRYITVLYCTHAELTKLNSSCVVY